MINDSSDFNELFESNNDICNHHRNIKTLLIIVFKMKNEFSSPILESTLNRRINTYNLKNFQEFVIRKIYSLQLPFSGNLQKMNSLS